MELTERADGHDNETRQYIKTETTVHDKPQKKEKSKKPRYRASIACVACRDRRIRCVVTPGQNECTRCKSSGGECVIKDDDERRRPISRAYMCSLTDRVALLENILRERGIDLPPTNHPPKSRHDVQDRRDTSANRTAAEIHTTNYDSHSPRSQSFMHEEHSDSTGYGLSNVLPIGADSVRPPPMLSHPRRESMVSSLHSNQSYFSLDQLSRPLRFFGPTTDRHAYPKFGDLSTSSMRTASREASTANRILANIPVETHDYLMELFWQFYNPVVHIIHRGAFLDDCNNGGCQYYSPFLHICVLAIGFRSANKDRMDIKKIALPQMTSTLHQEARQLLSYELEQPGGIPLIVALLLLSDLECGVGRDDLGWMYSGMAVRLAFDIGLHHDIRLSELSEHEISIRRMTLRTCIIYDRHWSLLLGRPTCMKLSDIDSSEPYKQPSNPDTNQSVGLAVNLETMIHEALFDLMELAGKIPEVQASDQNTDHNQYLQMAALDRDLSSWYARLPEQLCWTHENVATAPFPFFLLHQQYHSSLILLHRPYAQHENRGERYIENNHFSRLSRIVCTRNAIKVAQIYWQYRQRFNTELVFITGLQHAGNAAIALAAALVSPEDFNDRQCNMEYLDCLFAVIKDMSAMYQPAEHMSNVLHAIITDIRGNGSSFDQPTLDKPRSATVPARRNSEFESSNDESVSKRRQLANDNTRNRAMLYRKMSDTDKPLSFITQNFPRVHSRSRGRSRGASRNNSFHGTPTPLASEAPMSMLTAEFPHSQYPPAAHSAVNTFSGFESWKKEDLQMGTNFEPQYPITPPQNMQFTNMVHHPNSGANLGSVPLEGGEWGVRNQWYMRAGDVQPVDNFQGFMWEDGAELNYNHGMGDHRI